MIAHLGKIALMVVMTHGFRFLGRLANPKWAGLALGLPCSTAVALVGGGSDRGLDYAVAMSSNSLVGLAGAVALPIAYARAIQRGWRLPPAILIGVVAYLTVALSASRLLPRTGEVSLGVAAIAVVGAIWLSRRSPEVEEETLLPSRTQTSLSIRLLRTVVPILCLVGSLTMGEAFGPAMAGLMSTFPAMTLTVLILTHLESGQWAGLQMARSLPVGNLGMVAFLAAFRFCCPSLGLVWGTVLAYAAALGMLIVILIIGRFRAVLATELQYWQVTIGLLIDGDPGQQPSDQGTSSWPRSGRRFSPLMESLAA